MLEQGNSSLSQSVTVYPALPRQPAGDLLATVRRMMMRIMMVMTIIMMTFTKKTAGDLLATVRRMMMNGYIRDVEDGEDGDEDHHNMKTCQDEVSPGTRDGKTLQQ